MTAVVTTKGMLLKAVRKGDFQALLALADYWAETGDAKAVAAWDKLVERCRWHLANRDKLRMGVLESMARWMRDFLFSVNRHEDKPWRLPSIKNCVGVRWRSAGRGTWHNYNVTWDWCRDMADQLIRWAKAT